MKTALCALLLLGAAVPAAAQMPPPPPGEMMPDGPGGRPLRGQGKMFASMSEAGRAIMMSTMKASDPRPAHQATKAARDRMLAVLDAERLDPVALKRAMDDEREASTAAKIKQQAALLAGFQQLSPADRHAFVADARAMRMRMDRQINGPHGPGGMIPPPPPQ